MTWISVKDRQPNNEGSYLAYFGLDDCGEAIYGIVDYGAGHWDDLYSPLPVTHWMPLPERPA